ncbi:hypothetical protein KQ224_00360 [Streptococcus parasuis]|uniref:hypothetical protein n=1 Tax=Streptococcus parasuis TaxID=1501662 RepID=UPI001C1FE6F1|nr:hypothetical protein [Streptococcus parasuis]QWV86631.1 hypothetical protein KQ224_00360 [Streptococcus parasuis]
MAIFEDQFMEIQIGMVSLAMEYVNGQADDIYIYGISEKEIISYNVFFKIKDSFVKIHKVNSVLTNKVNDSDGMLFSVLRYGNEDLQALIDLCDNNGHEHPTELWLVYDAKSNHLETKYSYEARYENDEDLIPRLEFEKWFEEVKAEKNK